MNCRLNELKKTKHGQTTIPCEHCEFVGSPEEFNKHMKNTNNTDKTKADSKNDKKTSKGKGHKTNNPVERLCDMCEYVSVFFSHIW